MVLLVAPFFFPDFYLEPTYASDKLVKKGRLLIKNKEIMFVLQLVDLHEEDASRLI